MNRQRRTAHPAPSNDPVQIGLKARAYGRHLFTAPTPVAGRSGPVVSVMIPGWEIECCAPPPTVGEVTGFWRLGFVDGAKSPEPALDHEHEWSSSPWPEPTSRSACCLTDGAIRVYLPSPESPAAQRICLRGHISGTKHGGSGWDGFPSTTGLVTRVQLVTSDFACDERTRYYNMIPGTTTLADVTRSPTRFPANFIRDEFGRRTNTHGVLIDLIHHE